ncbi:type II toxin-antitoxin system HigB family toxin [Thermosynechococcaceae cyanobacterium BACA0444]|uniref:Type II toxin-antitoxin system HigB family toxin n=1 Tax=Pseudocalidococcus azoricus BACA0444 TaxID=2918990 RepID=A0AAE4FVE5_9CYAN|nr:type II toxin-antitoxin system HigB family toxin [Pseudocalidococcus azoricus]MDS3862267.1 type II toxin-antitoxin system HigB family toxin [Pseudocalidococcus azoricus BACA0444]
MRIISRKTLVAFWEQHPNYADACSPLEAWYQEVKHAKWNSPADVKEKYKSASVLKNGRIIFNTAGNKYHLVVKIHFNTQIVYVRFIGTHKEYDKIDPETI